MNALSRNAAGPPELGAVYSACSKPMVHRTAKQGANAGSAFWGCVDFPGCRGTKEGDSVT